MTPPAAEAFRIHADDNVATLLGDAGERAVVHVRGEGLALELEAEQEIRTGHKIALAALTPGDRVVKYGFPIGSATHSIAVGDWVHLQNCRSLYDALSSELDIESGARTETHYV